MTAQAQLYAVSDWFAFPLLRPYRVTKALPGIHVPSDCRRNRTACVLPPLQLLNLLPDNLI